MILRAAQPTDAGKLGAIMERFAEAAPWMPALWSGAEHIAHAGAMIDRGWVRVCEADGTLLGFIARDGTEIVALYVDNERRGDGVGKALLDEAKAAEARLDLWAHATNRGARRFYRRMGFSEAGHRSGAETDEGIPAIRYEWRRKTRARAGSIRQSGKQGGGESDPIPAPHREKTA